MIRYIRQTLTLSFRNCCVGCYALREQPIGRYCHRTPLTKDNFTLEPNNNNNNNNNNKVTQFKKMSDMWRKKNPWHSYCQLHRSGDIYKYKVVQIWPGLMSPDLHTNQSRSYLNHLYIYIYIYIYIYMYHQFYIISRSLLLVSNFCMYKYYLIILSYNCNRQFGFETWTWWLCDLIFFFWFTNWSRCVNSLTLEIRAEKLV